MEANFRRISFWRIKQPLVVITLSLMAGIALGHHAVSFPMLGLWLPLAMGILWFVVSWKFLPPPWPIIPWTVATGLWISFHALTGLQPVESEHLIQQFPQIPCYAVVRGIVRSDPSFREIKVHQLSSKTPSSKIITCEFNFVTTAFQRNQLWQPASGTILARIKLKTLPTSDDRITFGQTLELKGILDTPSRPRNFDLFDYADYLRRQGIHHILRVEKAQDALRIGERRSWSWIFKTRRLMAERLTLGIEHDPLACGIIRGMLLGYREDIPNHIYDAFRHTGTLHVFAISGSHITCIAFTLLLLLKQLRIPTRWMGIPLLPALVFYVIATGLRASAIRSLIMAAVVIVGWALDRPSVLLNNLAAAALIILAWDPLQLYDTGFQLSFVVVAFLILLTPRIDRGLQAWMEPDPFIPRACLPAWRRSIQPLLRWSASLVAATLAAWAGSFGLTMYHFHLISFVSLPANLIVVPLASLSVGLGLISLGLGATWDHLAILLNTSHAYVIHMMVFVAEKLASLRYGFFYVSRPPMLWIAAGYSLLGVILLLWIRGKWRCASFVALFSLGLAFTPILHHAFSDELRLDVIDVGNGQALLLSGPGFHRMLIDGGGERHVDPIMEPFLRSRGVNTLDLVILTHGDALHYGGIRELLHRFPIRRIAVAEAPFRSGSYRALLDTFHKRNISTEMWRAGMSKSLPCGRVNVIWPPYGKTLLTRADDLTLIFSLQTNFDRLLFASDVGKTVETLLASSASLESCNILVQGAHEHEDSLSMPWLRLINPEILVSLNARPLSPDTESLWRSQGVRVFCTGQTGGLILRLGRNGHAIESFFPCSLHFTQ